VPGRLAGAAFAATSTPSRRRAGRDVFKTGAEDAALEAPIRPAENSRRIATRDSGKTDVAIGRQEIGRQATSAKSLFLAKVVLSMAGRLVKIAHLKSHGLKITPCQAGIADPEAYLREGR